MANDRQRGAGQTVSVVDRAETTTTTHYTEVSKTTLVERDGWRKWRWLPWLLLLPLLALGTWWGVTHIEDDVLAAAPQILEEAGVDTSGLQFEADYRNVTVTGDLPEGVTRAEVEEILEEGFGPGEDEDIRNAFVEADEFAAAPVAEEPAALGAVDVTASSDGEQIVLRGTVPSEAHKAALLAEAEGTGLTVVDQLTVSGLDPSSDDADGQIGKLTAVIGGLTAGSFVAADLALGDDGLVSGNIDAADAAAASALAGVAGDGVNVTAPPELGSLAVDVDYDGERIILDGTVFSEAERDELVAAAAGVVGEENVVNNLEISDLDPAVDNSLDRVAGLAGAIATFGGLESAEGTMNDTDMTITGVAVDEAAKAATDNALSTAGDSGLRPGGEISVAEAEPEFTLEEEIALLQAELDALQDEIRETVRFDTDSDGLSPAAQATLDKVRDAMQRYQRPVVEVGGHTDSQGTDQYNLDLSQERSDAVAAYLTSAGVDAERLRGVGFGESVPIADNTLEEGRRQNRRVEFTAKEAF